MWDKSNPTGGVATPWADGVAYVRSLKFRVEKYVVFYKLQSIKQICCLEIAYIFFKV